MTEPLPHVLSKSAFARLRKVTPARVSQWLSEGKIGPEALAGEGRAAKIRVAVADAQLRQRLDLGQLAGNGRRTALSLAGDSAPPSPVEAEISAPEAARMVGLTPEFIQSLASRGFIPRVGRGRFRIVDVVRGYQRYLAGRSSARAPAPPTPARGQLVLVFSAEAAPPGGASGGE